MPVLRVLLVLAVVAAAGCTRWRQVHTLAPEKLPVSVRAARVTVTEGQSPIREPGVVVLRDAWITADSVIGWRDGAADRVAMRRDQVHVLEVRRVDPWRTAGTTLVVLAVAYAAALWYALSHMEW